MISDVLISVIIPVYNVEKYLRRCIDSVLNQSYTNLEILLIDDGSTDGSGNICDEYSANDLRVKTYHINNSGPANARNYGLEHCVGGYIAFVDSDDWIEPLMYEKLLMLALQHKTEITGCATMTDYEDGISKNSFEGRECALLSGKTAILDILYQTKYAWGAMYNKLYKRELFRNIRFPDVMNLEDYVVSTKLYNQVRKIYFCNLPMYHYTFRQGSLSKRGFFDKKIQVLDTAESIQEYFINDNASNDIVRGTNSFVFRMYADVFWQICRCKPENGKKMIKEKKKQSINVLNNFICNADKQKGDGKRLLKYLLSLIMMK